jgi:hypothetical protein
LNKISCGCLKQTIFKIKKASQNISTNFVCVEGLLKNAIFHLLLMAIISATRVFIKQFFRAAEKAPFIRPPRAVQGLGFGLDLSTTNHGFVVIVLKPGG